jgi:hypothetical protein
LDDDVLELGGSGDATIHLSFDLSHLRGRIGTAYLRLFPHPLAVGTGGQARLVVHRTGPFEGARTTYRNAPVARGGPMAERIALVLQSRPLTFDLSRSLMEAQRRGSARVFMAIRRLDGGGEGGLQFLSPRGTARNRRPRIELRLH